MNEVTKTTKTLTKKEIMQFLKEYHTGEIEKFIKSQPSQQDAFSLHAKEFYCLNKAIEKGLQNIFNQQCFFPTVFAVCDYLPPRLDKGKTWWSIYYIQSEKVEKRTVYYVSRLYIPAFMNRRRNGDLGFSSNIVGSSRLLSATNHVFRILEKMGGHYIQVKCL